jgi:hypothetical protein
MAVKQSYGIRTPMLSTALDTEITLQKDGVGLRPLPVKFVIITIGSGCAMLKVFTGDLVSVGSVPQKILFVALWLAMTVLLFFSGKTQQLNIKMLVSFLGYLVTPGNRRLRTRKLDPDAVLNMIDITNIRHIADDGMITFADKSVGNMYRITGNASVLLFESDRDRILNRVDTFYRTLDPDIEMIFMTLKEPQRVYQQAAAISRRHKSLTVHDEDLTKLANNQLSMLKNTVGRKFKSVHQYMIVKASSPDTLQSTKQSLQTELNQSAMFIRKCVPLNAQDVAEQLAVVFSSPKIEEDLDLIKDLV